MIRSLPKQSARPTHTSSSACTCNRFEQDDWVLAHLGMVDKNATLLANYKNRFFSLRSPFVGLLDPQLHTPEYVYSTSFTLFSAICALGCAISTRPRDKMTYPSLYSLAEKNVQWSIAVSVRCLETIQAIVLMQYWAPVRHRLSDDPYWLHLSHVRDALVTLNISCTNESTFGRRPSWRGRWGSTTPTVSTDLSKRVVRMRAAKTERNAYAATMSELGYTYSSLRRALESSTDVACTSLGTRCRMGRATGGGIRVLVLAIVWLAASLRRGAS